MTAIVLTIIWLMTIVIACFFGWIVGRDASANEMMKNGKTHWKGLIYVCDRIFPE